MSQEQVKVPTAITIDRGIPMPKSTKKSKTDIIDFDSMEIGDSIFINFVGRASVQNAARAWASEVHAKGLVAEIPKFIYADERDGFRMWRKS